MDKRLYEIEPFACGYLAAERDDPAYRIACGMYSVAKHRPLKIEADACFVSCFDKAEPYFANYMYGNGIRVSHEAYLARIEAYPAYEKELTALYEAMLPHDTEHLVHLAESEEERTMHACRAGWGGGQYGWCIGHSNPDYLLTGGVDAVRTEIESARKQNPEKNAYYDAMTIALDALLLYAGRYLALAKEALARAKESDKARLARLTRALEQVPRGVPRDFYEACVSFWLSFSFDGYDSPGRFDQYMLPYYRMGDFDREEILGALWQCFRDTRSWNLTLGGSDETGKDESNELTLALLRTAAKYKYNTPNLTLRVHPGTPEEIMEGALDAVGTGIGMPVLYNDACVCPALEALGIPPGDAHDYCMNGCNQIDIFGKSNMGLEDGEVSLAKCLELALFGGICQITGGKAGLLGEGFSAFSSYTAFFEEYKRQVEYITDLAVSIANKTQTIAAREAPNPYRSLLFAGCIERGADFKAGGTLYYNGQILAEGIADTVDSLAVIKHFVYDTRQYTQQEVLAALRSDFEGYDEMLTAFQKHEKFGNDGEMTNEISRAVINHFFGYLLTKGTARGGVYGGGCSPFNRAAMYGAAIGALPNGKRRDSALLADSIGATPGADRSGITALLRSALAHDQTMAKSGHVLQLKYNKGMLDDARGRAAMRAHIRTYFASGGQQMTISLLSREELLDARVHPERYPSLIVRVGGYSAKFTELSPELQENIIRRTEYCS